MKTMTSNKNLKVGLATLILAASCTAVERDLDSLTGGDGDGDGDLSGDGDGDGGNSAEGTGSGGDGGGDGDGDGDPGSGGQSVAGPGCELVCSGTPEMCVVEAADADEDTFGDASCEQDPGDDCDDTNEDKNPDATELCDLIDNDCDGIAENGATFTATSGSKGVSGVEKVFKTRLHESLDGDLVVYERIDISGSNEIKGIRAQMISPTGNSLGAQQTIFSHTYDEDSGLSMYWDSAIHGKRLFVAYRASGDGQQDTIQAERHDTALTGGFSTGPNKGDIGFGDINATQISVAADDTYVVISAAGGNPDQLIVLDHNLEAVAPLVDRNGGDIHVVTDPNGGFIVAQKQPGLIQLSRLTVEDNVVTVTDVSTLPDESLTDLVASPTHLLILSRDGVNGIFARSVPIDTLECAAPCEGVFVTTEVGADAEYGGEGRWLLATKGDSALTISALSADLSEAVFNLNPSGSTLLNGPFWYAPEVLAKSDGTLRGLFVPQGTPERDVNWFNVNCTP